ncbi:MAG TPA: hypothetical protein VGW38_17590 [Chloroflexota bacterium]|nr:hypothetical protein [Chloroflexota bacterium]
MSLPRSRPDQARQPAHQPEMVVREYRSSREYRRVARQRRREGWRTVSVLQRPAPPSRTRRLLPWGSLLSPETEYLVTYQRTDRTPDASKPLRWLFSTHIADGLTERTRTSHLWWLLLAFLLFLLLAYGLWSFFAEAIDAVPL